MSIRKSEPGSGRLRRSLLLLSVSTALFLSPVMQAEAQDADQVPSGTGQLPSFAPLVKRVMPAVVNISVVEKSDFSPIADGPGFTGQGGPQMGTPFDDLLRHFFDQGPGQQFHFGPTQRGPVTALGSGFIIDPSGYVVTNNHVVGNADKVTVIFQDDSRHKATVVGKDERTDLALLKIDAPQPLPYVHWGDSDKLSIGDWVVAVGNPFGLGGTVTQGILSARGRSVGESDFVDYMQIDAPVNRGNSGGPTFDQNGDVVGINSAIYSPNGGSVGIAFDIPSDTAKGVIEQLKVKGHVDRGWLGVAIQQVTPDIASAIGLDKNDPIGALVADVTKDSPAAKAGIKVGDVIESVDGTKIKRLNELPRLVANLPAGKSARFTVLRQGQTIDLDVITGRLKEKEIAANQAGSSGEASDGSAVGLSLSSLNAENRQRLGIANGVEGALVSRVAEDSKAANAGLQPGDVIERVDGAAVKGPADAIKLLHEAERHPEKPLLVLVARQDATEFVAIPLGSEG